MAELNLQKIRQLLEAEKAEILAHVSGESNGRSDDFNPDRDDLAQDYIAIERGAALLAIEREQLKQINAALARIESGAYGICADCGETIPAERLEILPYATLCVRCQSKQARW